MAIRKEARRIPQPPRADRPSIARPSKSDTSELPGHPTCWNAADKPYGPRMPATADVSTPQPASLRRRAWVSRAVLFGVLIVQAVLSLRLQNTAFPDEALYLYAGHLQLDHLLDGRPLPEDFTRYFSGSPVLYPTLAAAVDASSGSPEHGP